MLILDPREKFIYPFAVGDYTEIRMGMYFSITPTTGDNGLLVASDLQAKTSPKNALYWGFCNFNTGSLLPLQSGYDFIGSISKQDQQCGSTFGSTTDSNIRLGDQAGNGQLPLFLTDTTGATQFLASLAPSDIVAKCPTSSAGFNAYAGMAGLQLMFSGTNLFSFRAFGDNGTYVTNTTLTNLRNDMSTLGTNTSSLTTVYTGFFTSGGGNNSNVMMKPNSIMMYFPMLNSKIRLHAIAVERYA